MALKIPNDPTAPVQPAAYAVQSQVDQGDLDALVAGFYGTGVVSGLAVTPHSSGVSLNVDVAAGTVVVQSAQKSVAAVSNLTIAAADGTNPRIDLIVVSSSGVVSVLAGTASATPDYATLTFDGSGNLNQVLLAAVTVPATATSITANNVIDKRVWRRVTSPASRLALRALYR